MHESRFINLRLFIFGVTKNDIDHCPAGPRRPIEFTVSHRRPIRQSTKRKKKTPLPDAWLCPIEKRSPNYRRGILDMTLGEYIDLVDWSGRKLLENKRGAIPAHLSPILLCLNVEEKRWLNTVRDFGRMFHRAAGRMESIIAAAQKTGRRWLKGFRTCDKVFSST